MNDNKPTPVGDGRLTTSPRLWSEFRDCRKKAYWRFAERLEPLEAAWNLRFGRLIHECLESWHESRDLALTLAVIDEACATRESNLEAKRTWHLARAMMTGYAARYEKEDFAIVALGATFRGDIVNPATGKKSRSFCLSDRVDGVVRLGDKNYLLEHRTASSVDDDYLKRLWADFQVTLRANYIERQLEMPISGVVYDILVKAKLKQSPGESVLEFSKRRDALIAKSKSGKSKAKQQLPESDETFAARLAARYSAPSMFHREIVEFDNQRRAELSFELWELTQSLLDARRRNAWYPNTSFCFHYRRPCEYLALCQSNGAASVKDKLYRVRTQGPRPSRNSNESSVNNSQVAV